MLSDEFLPPARGAYRRCSGDVGEETFICNSSTIAQFGNQNIVTVVSPHSTDSTRSGRPSCRRRRSRRARANAEGGFLKTSVSSLGVLGVTPKVGRPARDLWLMPRVRTSARR
jgi:hypothetical protein